MNRRTMLAAPLATPLLVASAAQAQASLVTEEFMIPAGDAGIELFLRNKRPENLNAFSPARTVLFVHGATYPAHTAFDLPLGGLSWMDYIAGQGFDVWCLDIRGYGRSTRPPEMSQPPEANPPIVRGYGGEGYRHRGGLHSRKAQCRETGAYWLVLGQRADGPLCSR